LLFVSHNLTRTRARIAAAEQAAGQTAGEVRLLAVSKTKSEGDIRAAATAGQRDFGENYLQEAVRKIVSLQGLRLTWHFIGAIQSNKTRDIARHFHWVHTLDRYKIARRLSDQCPADKVLNVLIQVNIDADPAKSGVAPGAAQELVEATKALPGLAVRGLMTILERNGNAEESFQRMHVLFNDLRRSQDPQWDTLSMGMSADMELAIANGATLVRIGTDIFGPRAARIGEEAAP
jgi:hypothetical protein|tara:strand:- start:5032 stop:5733 length:702 start_codon:yes stop_codon:yes gene_type:complete